MRQNDRNIVDRPLTDDEMKFAALGESASNTEYQPEPVVNNNELLSDGHDNLTFAADDLQTFGALVTDNATSNLEKVRALTDELLDCQTNGDDIRASEIVNELNTYFAKN